MIIIFLKGELPRDNLSGGVFLSFPLLFTLIWHFFLLFFSLCFPLPTTSFFLPHLSMVEFVKLWREGEAVAIQADLLSVLIEKGEKPNSSSQVPSPAKDWTLPMAERNAPFISSEREAEFFKV